MDQKIKHQLESLLTESTGEKIEIKPGVPISGGCINSAMTIYTNVGDTFFLKYNINESPKMFEAEAKGLIELAKPGVILIPKVIAYSENNSKDIPFILMEYLPSTAKSKQYYEEFGRQFAELHKFTQDRFGFDEDNFIGSTPQKNDWMDNWVDFYREKRLGFQIQLAKDNNYWNNELDTLWDSVSSQLDGLIGKTNEAASLLHGDLWSGNYIVGPNGEPCIIDPAVYYGHREADLAMTELFGGFHPNFYASYNETYPLEPGYKERSKLYQLYHLINHLNLFGTGYLGQVQSILKYFAKG